MTARPAKGRVQTVLGLVALLAGLVGFVIWGASLVGGSKKPPAPPPPGDPTRAAELISDLAPKLRSDADARSECLGALRMLESRSRGAALVAALQSPDASITDSALYCAGDFVADDEGLLPLLFARWDADPTDLATYALSRTGSPEALERITRALTAPAAEKLPAIWALAVWEGDEATDTLLGLLATEPDPMVGMMTAEALGYRRDAGAYRELVNLLQTIQPVAEPSMIGERAALALAYLEQKAAVKSLREASHRIGDYNTTERLTLAFALCRLRPNSDYNFRVLQRALTGQLADARYRESGPDEFVTAVRLFIQLDDPRVKQVLIDASQTVDDDRTPAIVAGFAALGLEPAYDNASRGYVLRELPPDRAPQQKPWVLTPPWPFGDAR